MKYIEVMWHEDYNNQTSNEKYILEWHNKEGLPRAYIPEEMVNDNTPIEFAFERLTGISNYHIITSDLEANYVLDEELDFIDINELKNNIVTNNPS